MTDSGNSVGSAWNLRMLVPMAIAVLSIVGAIIFWRLSDRPVAEIVVATGPEGGAYHRIGRRIAEVLKQGEVPLAEQVSDMETPGSMANAELLGTNDKPTFALVQADTPLPPNARLITRLYEERLYIVARPKGTAAAARRRILTPESFATEGSKKRVFLGAENSGTLRMARNLLAFFGIDDRVVPAEGIATRRQAVAAMKEALAATKAAEARVDAIVLLDTYPSSQVEELVSDGAVLVSLGDPEQPHNECATLTLRYPTYHTFVLPRRAYPDLEPIQTVSVSALLVANTEVPYRVAREATRRIFADRWMLTRPLPGIDDEAIPSMRAFRERFEPTGHLLTFHEGAESFYRRSEPSFLGENAELLSFIMGIIGVLFSGLLFTYQRFGMRKKNRIDRYYIDVKEISDAMKGAGREKLLQLREDLDVVRERAFGDLVKEKVEANESFIIFQNFVTGQARALEARLRFFGVDDAPASADD